MRTRVFGIALILVFFVSALYGSLAFAANVTVTPASGPGGMVVTATSSGFDVAHVGYNTGFYVTTDNVHYQFVGACPGPPGTDGWANCSIQITMPGATGPYTVAAFNSNREFASTTFEALRPSLTVSPTCGPDNTGSIAVTGKRWAVGYDAGIYLDGSLVRAGNYPSDDGSFDQEISGPSADGVHTIKVANSVGQTVSKNITTPICAGIGIVDEIEGSAEVTHADGTSGPLAAGDPVKKDDTITVGAGGRVKLLFNDQTTFMLSSGTKLTLDDYVYDPATHQGSTFTNVLVGSFEYISGLIAHTPDPDNQQIDVVWGSIGIRGTRFVTQIGVTSAEVDLLDGSVDVSPFETLATTSYTGPIRIVFNAHGSVASPLTEEQYDAIRDGLFPPASSDSTPPQVTVTFPSAPAGQSGFFNASQAPVSGSVTAADPSNVTAILCGDTLGGLSIGAVNGLNTSSAGEALSLSGDGSHVVSCTAIDGANNSGAAMGSSNSATVKVDATGPTVSYSAHPATYTVDQAVTITCTAADGLSGLASSTCQNVSGSAYSFSLGSHTYSAKATDKAGNSGAGSTQFTVVDTYDGLIALVNRFEAKPSIAATMVSTLRGAQTASANGNASSANKQLSAFINQVEAQSGKSLTAEQASILVRLATALKT